MRPHVTQFQQCLCVDLSTSKSLSTQTARTRPFLPCLETGIQINTEVCDDGQRDKFALGWCPGAVFNLHTGLRQSYTRRQEGTHSASQNQIWEVKNLRPQRSCWVSSFLLPAWTLFHLDQILLWDAVNFCQLLQTVER